MYNRKEIKQRAREVLKRSFWVAVFVCFIMSMLTSAYAGADAAANAYNADNETTDAVQNDITADQSSDTVQQLYDDFVRQNPNAGYLHRFAVQAVCLGASFVGSNSLAMSVARLVAASADKTALFKLILLTIGLVISILYSVFIAGVLMVGEKRFFLEARSCKDVGVKRIFMPWRYRTSRRAAWISFKKNLFLALWFFTIIGGFIKMYEYALVEYIAAENPALGAKDVFALSKRMMKGYKWKMFLLDLSFIGWDILSSLTLGVVGVLYSNPYKTCARTEFYAFLRDNLTGDDKEKLCDAQLVPFMGEAEYDDEINSVYIFGSQKLPHRPINAGRKYSVQALILLFFFFSMFGWVWEVLLHVFKDGVFVNRGTMFGPWLPIYGAGGILVLLLMRRFMKNVPLTFGLTMVVCGIVEYFTSWFLEYTKGVKWWDYSGYFMNLNGRICLEGLLVFGLGGCAFLYYVAPRADDIIEKMPKNVQTTLCVVLCVLFGADAVYSSIHPNVGKGITDYPTAAQDAALEAASKAAETGGKA